MESGKNGRLMLPVLFVAAFAGAYNAQCVSVAIGPIASSLQVGLSDAQWLVSGYMLVQAIVMVVFAFLFRRFNTRSLFLTAAVLFIVGELAAMVAPSFGVLLAARILQACGGALFIPLMMNAIVMTSSPDKLASALSIGNIAIGVAPSFAPTISGVLVVALGWRSVFVVPLACIVICALVGLKAVTPLARPEHIRLDVASFVVVAVALASFVYSMSVIVTNPLVGIVALVIAAVCAWAFARRQASLERPLLNLSPLRNRTFAVCAILVIITIMQSFSMPLLLPTFFKGAFGIGEDVSGLLLLIPTVVMLVVMMLSGTWFDRSGAWPILPVGFAVLVLGLVLCVAFGLGGSVAGVVVAAALVFGGCGLVQSPVQAVALAPLSEEENPDGVSIVNVCIQLASAVGPALFTGVVVAASGGASTPEASAAGFVSAIVIATVIGVVGLVLATAVARASRTR